VRPKQRAVENLGSPAGSRATGWQHARRGLVLALSELAILTLVVVALKAVIPVEALASLYVLAVLPIAVGWGFAWALTVAVLSTVMFDLFVTPPLFALTITDTVTVAQLMISVLTAYVVSGLAARAERRRREAESLAGELRGIAEEQAALRRVATLVAQGRAPEEVFAAVTAEVRTLVAVEMTAMGRYDPDGVVTMVGWSVTDPDPAPPARTALGGRNVTTLVFETGRPARIDDFSTRSGAAAEAVRAMGVRATVGVPITLEGGVWGVMLVSSTHSEPLPSDTEARLAGFTELVGTAVANAQARTELRSFAEEQAALQRVATLVAQGRPAQEVFAAVTGEVGAMLDCDFTLMNRYDPDRMVTVVGVWARAGGAPPVRVGHRTSFDGRNVTAQVLETGRPTRIDHYGPGAGAGPAPFVAAGIRSVAGAPINVEGRLWGVMMVLSSQERLPTGTEARLAEFTELVATAVANAEARRELTASRARIVTAADNARRRIERNLHDGAQQHLISLALQLRALQATVPPDAGPLAARLGQLTAELTDVVDELRDFARGIHPAILAKGGLRPGLMALARRSSTRVDLAVRIDGRLPEPVEEAAYYVVSEALTNAAKHADASAVHVEVDATADGHSVLRVCVHDDGRGGADFTRGSGLVGLKDRVEALGGRFSVQSPVGGGTRLDATLRFDPASADAG
jgi:signal transduction histidine kinase